MSDYQQKVSGTLNERMRLYRLRRKKENLRFWDEFRIIPNGVTWTLVALFLIAQAVAFLVNRWNAVHYDALFPYELRDTRLSGVGRNRYRCIALRGRDCFLRCLCQSRCETAWNELRGVDAARDRAAPRVDVRRLLDLFPNARTAAVPLPTMRKARRGPFQLLPKLQMQPASQLPQLQTRSHRNGQILPLLRAGIGSRKRGRAGSAWTRSTKLNLSPRLAAHSRRRRSFAHFSHDLAGGRFVVVGYE